MPNIKLVVCAFVVSFGYIGLAVANGVPASAAPAESEVLNDSSGLYIGLQAGVANVDEGDGLEDYVDGVYAYDKSLGNIDVEKNSEQESFGGHAFIGYGFNKYIALEIGGSFLPENKYSVVAGNIYDIDVDMETYDVDAMLRFSLPLGNAWTVYARGGIAYENVDFNDSDDSDMFSQTNHGVRPIYGLGIAYNIVKSIAIDASWTEINGTSETSYTHTDNPLSFGINNLDDVLPTVDLFALGITYRFNDMF